MSTSIDRIDGSINSERIDDYGKFEIYSDYLNNSNEEAILRLFSLNSDSKHSSIPPESKFV